MSPATKGKGSVFLHNIPPGVPYSGSWKWCCNSSCSLRSPPTVIPPPTRFLVDRGADGGGDLLAGTPPLGPSVSFREVTVANPNRGTCMHFAVLQMYGS